jgi:hypothetical protein
MLARNCDFALLASSAVSRALGDVARHGQFFVLRFEFETHSMFLEQQLFAEPRCLSSFAQIVS